MEHREHQNLRIFTQLMNSEFPKKVTQLLLSVSVFTFLLSHPYLLSLLQAFNFYFAKFPYQLVTHTLDKNCIFLLCNGLVVFLAKYSGLIRSLSSSSSRADHESFSGTSIDGSQRDCSMLAAADRKHMVLENLHHDESIFITGIPPEYSMSADTKEMILEKEIPEEVVIDVAMHEETESECSVINPLDKETEEAIVGDQDQEQEAACESIFSNGEEDDDDEAEEEEKQKRSNGGLLVGETVEEEEEVNAKLSTEELNKKFDEFIRRMKAEIRIESQAHLIMV